jgi:hypothetical protein
MKYWPKVDFGKCWSGILSEVEDAGRSIAIFKKKQPRGTDKILKTQAFAELL